MKEYACYIKDSAFHRWFISFFITSLTILFIIWNDSSVQAQSAPSIESINPSEGESGTTFEVTIKGLNTTFNKDSEIEVVKRENREDVTVKLVKFISPTKLIVTVEITPSASPGVRTFIITSQKETKEETVEAQNIFTVIPPKPPEYNIYQRSNPIRYSLIPDEPVILKYPGDEVFIKARVFTENGQVDERKIKEESRSEGSYSVYDLGTFGGGDKIEMTIYKNKEEKEDNIVVPHRTLRVRPGPVSIRSGIILVSGLNRVRTPVSIFTRFYRKEGTFGESTFVYGLGAGFGISVENDPRVYTAGIQYEFFDTVDITGGFAWYIDADKIYYSGYGGVTFDLRFFKKIVDTTTAGLALK